MKFYTKEAIALSIDLEIDPKKFTLGEFLFENTKLPTGTNGMIEKLLGPTWEYKYLHWC